MKEQTKKFYLSIILSLIVLFLISCDNKDKTGAEEVKKEERTLSYYAGNWWAKFPGKTDSFSPVPARRRFLPPESLRSPVRRSCFPKILHTERS